MSIWSLLSRDTFENDVATLYARTSPQSHRLAPLPPGLSQREARLQKANTTVLAYDTELQLAEDFPFLASWENIPPCVSAATITQIDDTGGACLSIAANEGIADDVDRASNRYATLWSNARLAVSD